MTVIVNVPSAYGPAAGPVAPSADELNPNYFFHFGQHIPSFSPYDVKSKQKKA